MNSATFVNYRRHTLQTCARLSIIDAIDNTENSENERDLRGTRNFVAVVEL